MSEMLEMLISILKYPNDFTEVWFSNLLLEYLINDWPECWGFPVDILMSHLGCEDVATSWRVGRWGSDLDAS